MSANSPNCIDWFYSDNSGGNLVCDGDGSPMGKEDRLEQVLDLLAESGYALPPSVIYRNLQLTEDRVTFEERSMKNYMPELVERGLAIRIDPEELSNGRVVETGPGDAYYLITDKGREWLADRK